MISRTSNYDMNLNESLEATARRLGIVVLMMELELKTRYIESVLRSEGVSEIILERNFDKIIFEMLNLDEANNKSLEQLTAILEKHTSQILNQPCTMLEQAREACLEWISFHNIR